jgi:predicted nucleic acid-binding protein
MRVSNSSPLIYLSKLGQLHLLRELFGEVATPASAMSEIMRGKERGYADVAAIEKARQDGWLKSVELKRRGVREVARLRQTFSDISQQDAAALVLAKDLNATFLVDDDRVAKVADLLGVKHAGTLRIILLATEKRLLTKTQAEKLFLSLLDHGFYISHDLLAEFLKQLAQI